MGARGAWGAMAWAAPRMGTQAGMESPAPVCGRLPLSDHSLAYSRMRPAPVCGLDKFARPWGAAPDYERHGHGKLKQQDGALSRRTPGS